MPISGNSMTINEPSTVGGREPRPQLCQCRSELGLWWSRSAPRSILVLPPIKPSDSQTIVRNRLRWSFRDPRDMPSSFTRSSKSKNSAITKLLLLNLENWSWHVFGIVDRDVLNGRCFITRLSFHDSPSSFSQNKLIIRHFRSPNFRVPIVQKLWV